MATQRPRAIFPVVPATFDSDLDIDDAVSRLAAAARNPGFAFESIAGVVSPSRVLLFRYLQDQQSPLRPMFQGSFHTVDGRTLLRGHFGMSPFMKVASSVFLAIGLIATLIALFQWIAADGTIGAVLASSGFFLIGSFAVAGLQGLHHEDVEWVSKQIRATLAGIGQQ